MKTIQSIHFNEMIFIPAKTRFQEEKPYWYSIGSIEGKNDHGTTKIEVILMNCTSPEEIPALFEKEISMLKEYMEHNPDSKESIENRIDYFIKLQKDILPQSPLQHDPPEELIDHIAKNGFLNLKKEEVLFLSGVERLIET